MAVDPYLWPNGVLRNKLKITDGKKLKQAEADICISKMIDVDKVFDGRLDIELIKRIHRYLFGDIYEWAGEFRDVPLYKFERVLPRLSLEYSKPGDIKRNLSASLVDLNGVDWNKLSLDEKSVTFARKLSLLWKVHPFRDGNTRTMMAFASLYSRSKGFPIDLISLVPFLNREYYDDGIEDEDFKKVKRYSIRDYLVLASLDDKDLPAPEHLGRLIRMAILSERSKKTKEEDMER